QNAGASRGDLRAHPERARRGYREAGAAGSCADAVMMFGTRHRKRQRFAVALAASLLVGACGDRQEHDVATQSASSVPPQVEPPIVPAPPVPAVTQAAWAPAALEELLAPIALYPDQLLGQILAASVNSQEVLDAGNWLLENQQLQGDALDAAATKAGFGPAIR